MKPANKHPARPRRSLVRVAALSQDIEEATKTILIINNLTLQSNEHTDTDPRQTERNTKNL